MKTHPSILLPALLLPIMLAEAHEFTLPGGASASGSITAVANGRVSIQTAGGGLIHVPVASLAPQDRDHARSWWEENRRFWFGIEHLPKKGQDRVKGGEGMLDTTTQDWVYHVKIHNKDAFAASALRAEYAVFVIKAGEKQPVTAVKEFVSLRDLMPGGACSLVTKPVKIKAYRPPDGYFFVHGHNQLHKDQVYGICIQILSGQRVVWVHESKPGLLIDAGHVRPGQRDLSRTGGVTAYRAYSGPPGEYVAASR